MILLDGSLDIDASSHQAADRDPRHQAPAPPGGCCLRCGGLLVLSYTASLELDVTGTSVTLFSIVHLSPSR